MEGIIGFEVPNNHIYKFDGTLCLPTAVATNQREIE
jgi:hypothetical protein